MALTNILLPAMGEGVIEATIIRWLVPEGSAVKEDDPLVEVATDKVDSEIPAPGDGRLVQIIAREESVIKVGDPIAVLDLTVSESQEEQDKIIKEVERIRETIDTVSNERIETENIARELRSRTPSGKFLSPLVRTIASKEKISYSDLDKITGTGMDGRITKDDILKFLESGKVQKQAGDPAVSGKEIKTVIKASGDLKDNGDEIIKMDRVRKLIADHMVQSKKISPHVTSFIDADVTKLVKWRNSVKDKFLASEGYKLTLTPIFIDATARALSEYPMINISVEGNNIIRKKNINIGMATALPDGNLIVPVIKNADEKNLNGIARNVSDLADRARKNKLKPEEITGGTFTLTNFGSFDNLAGTPIINQPQVAILGTGAVRKTPAVIETPDGDVIAIRYIMILSLSYDHRVIDGALAGKFLKKIKEILENYSSDIIISADN